MDGYHVSCIVSSNVLLDKGRDFEKTEKTKKDESEKTLNSGLHVFVISLFRLRYFVMSPSLFRYVAFVISSFRLFAFVFSLSSFRLFVMAPSLCRREITKRRNGTNQPPYKTDRRTEAIEYTQRHSYKIRVIEIYFSCNNYISLTRQTHFRKCSSVLIKSRIFYHAW